MKRSALYFSIIAVAVITFGLAGFRSMSKSTVKPSLNTVTKGFSVVELFTSEGCSSCPAAEEVVAKLLAKKTADVYILSYHVDYWNKLGWKDEFSDPGYTERQNKYAAAFGLNSIYTPQVVVNGSTEFVGSDENKLTAAVQKDLLTAPAQSISIDVKTNANLVTVNYEIAGGSKEAQFINIALVQPEATVAVKRGENGGRTLHHINIVRELKTVEAVEKGLVNVQIPNNLVGAPLQVIAFTQAKKDFHITAVEQKTL